MENLLAQVMRKAGCGASCVSQMQLAGPRSCTILSARCDGGQLIMTGSRLTRVMARTAATAGDVLLSEAKLSHLCLR